PAPAEDRLRVVATIFPQFDFVRHIAGERVALTMLLSPGAESHGFEPTPRDIITINNADLLIYVGGHGDVWVDPILASLGREDMRVVALLDLVDAVMQEHPHGGHHEHHGHHHHHDHHGHHDHNGHDHHGHAHHDHGHHHTHGHHHHDHHGHAHHHTHHHHHHEPHYDEHVWTCPRNAIVIVRALTEALSELDPGNAYYFRANAAAFITELQALDRAFADVVANAARTTVVFGDRFPFRYLTDTYGLTYFAAFTGCSAETQASPATIALLIETVRQENIPVVFHIEFSNRFIANVIAEATGARLLELHSLHNVSHADFTAGVTYLDLMRRNVETLREALN
ncbi:MAG: metal ABC transporter substrate-binding protein, partial [Treponema sp.]|nr:metal ABC transporter substrate-binding protein [Treponema sp.]